MNRKSGNQAQTTHSSPSISLSRRGILQRQCECGNAAGLSGKCEGCDSTRLSQPQGSSLPTHEQPPSTSIGYSFGQMAVDVPRSPVVQAKLTIGKPNDQYEQEADRVASDVVDRINNPAVQQESDQSAIQHMGKEEEEKIGRSPEMLQRKGQEEEEKLQMKPIQLARKDSSGGEAAPDLSSAINQARGHGKPLEAGLQNSMGQAMGADFSRVRVHTDAQADQLNRSIQAKAFTTGQDVFFRQGEYNPGSRGGQELIAHELTHVVQQNSGAVMRSPQQQMQLQRQHNSSTLPFTTNSRAEVHLNYPASYLNGVVQRHHLYGKSDYSDGTTSGVEIYKVSLKKNDDVVYIGQTCDQVGYKKRFENHLTSGYHPKWSHATHKITKIEGGDWTLLEASIAEQYWIDHFGGPQRFGGPLENDRNQLTRETWKKYRDDDVTTPNFKGQYAPKN